MEQAQIVGEYAKTLPHLAAPEPLASSPSTDVAGDIVLADGTNWDSDGNAEHVTRNTAITGWVEVVDLRSSL